MIALVQGAIFRALETKTAKSGRQFVSTSLKVKDGNTIQWVKVIAFSESAMTELNRLADGDNIAVQGGLRCETYEKDAETKISFTIFADHVLALRAPKKAKASKSAGPPKQPAKPSREPGDLSRYPSVTDEDLNDACPF